MTATLTQRRDLAEIIGSLAAAIRHGRLGPGDLAQLRRLSAETPDQPAFWRVLSEWIAPDDSLPEEMERRWAVALAGLARLASIGHHPECSFGAALARAGYSEMRLMRLLRARPPQMGELMRQACSYLAAHAQPVNWVSIVAFVLTIDKDKAETVRRSVARDYYSTVRREEGNKGRNK
jgi:CRISPR system Cascade subunit CasB